MMKALFYNQQGILVWECTKDARLEFTNGSRAIRKGAVRGILQDAAGNKIDEVNYHRF